MIFGDGSTSYSSFRLTYPNTSNATTTNKTVEIKMRDLTTEPKRYEISYEFTNNKLTTDVGVEFMFHADTAYNNNDQCEGYARPNMVSIGHYSVIDDWGYYTNLNNSLGGTTEREDLGFSLYYTDTSRNGEILQ